MNLQEVVQTLIDGGLSEADIAKQIRVSQPTVHRIKHGADPAYTTGKRLEELHRSRMACTGAARTEHPAENRVIVDTKRVRVQNAQQGGR